uniref:ABC transporter domain-containing protein n=1 Tax=Chromera velia CCMP2878 TaxID=1169474 RepID=A0A0G4IE84_9ALVE|eukprot:Cvel_2401.t1-p1 / transcript=Cvel_2401.t1 / gene=Cvel_2401 / organism=Chromera_velia_CCMP2878 / gene_product=ATP-binding cassette sub-family G member 1, putative / transcript_product=ATP-binding cassette sub-family G member 1, putative / location=Cvel_scaffold93:122666-131657(-) / protein_length=1016 / sequence_SO=supercontig / SO=protein_coding / is_pseudo=false
MRRKSLAGGALNVLRFEDCRFSVSTGRRKARKEILKGVSGVVYGGEVLAILGPSGAGKSTLLGMLTADSQMREKGGAFGSIFLNGKPLGARQFRQSCAYMTQEDQLPGFLTCREALLYTIELCSDASQHLNAQKTDFLIELLGKTAYRGDAPGLVTYLEAIGEPLPANSNPADFILDLVNKDFTSASTVDRVLEQWRFYETSVFDQLGTKKEQVEKEPQEGESPKSPHTPHTPATVRWGEGAVTPHAPNRVAHPSSSVMPAGARRYPRPSIVSMISQQDASTQRRSLLINSSQSASRVRIQLEGEEVVEPADQMEQKEKEKEKDPVGDSEKGSSTEKKRDGGASLPGLGVQSPPPAADSREKEKERETVRSSVSSVPPFEKTPGASPFVHTSRERDTPVKTSSYRPGAQMGLRLSLPCVGESDGGEEIQRALGVSTQRGSESKRGGKGKERGVIAAPLEEGFTLKDHPGVHVLKMVPKHPPFLKQTWIHLRRQALLSVRNPIFYFGRALACLFSGVFFSLVYINARERLQTQIISRTFFYGGICGVAPMFAVVTVYVTSEEIAYVSREVRNGMYKVTSYLLANFLLQVPYMFLLGISSIGASCYGVMDFNSSKLGRVLAVYTLSLWVFEVIAQACGMASGQMLMNMCLFLLACWVIPPFCQEETRDSLFLQAKVDPDSPRGFSCDADVPELECFGRTGTQVEREGGRIYGRVLGSLSLTFPTLSTDDTYMRDCLNLLAIGLFFKAVHVGLVVRKTTMNSKPLQPLAEQIESGHKRNKKGTERAEEEPTDKEKRKEQGRGLHSIAGDKESGGEAESQGTIHGRPGGWTALESRPIPSTALATAAAAAEPQEEGGATGRSGVFLAEAPNRPLGWAETDGLEGGGSAGELDEEEEKMKKSAVEEDKSWGGDRRGSAGFVRFLGARLGGLKKVLDVEEVESERESEREGLRGYRDNWGGKEKEVPAVHEADGDPRGKQEGELPSAGGSTPVDTRRTGEGGGEEKDRVVVFSAAEFFADFV